MLAPSRRNLPYLPPVQTSPLGARASGELTGGAYLSSPLARVGDTGESWKRHVQDTCDRLIRQVEVEAPSWSAWDAMLRERSDILKPTLSALRQRLESITSKPASYFNDLAQVSEALTLALEAAQSALILVPDALATVAEYASCGDVPGSATEMTTFHQLVLAEVFELPPDSQVPSADFMVSVQYLMCFDNLKQMRLSNNPIGDDGVRILADGLSRNSQLQELELISCNIGIQGAVALAMALGGDSNHGLTTLALSANSIRDEGSVALALALEGNQTLSVLELEGCLIGPKGAAAVAHLLLNNRTLESIDLSDNLLCGISQHGQGEFDPSGIADLIKALQVNESLQSINLLSNMIEAPDRARLVDLLSPNQDSETAAGLRTVCGLHSMNVTPDFTSRTLLEGDVLMLAEELLRLGEFSPVVSLNVGSSEISDDVAVQFARILSGDSALESLEVDASRLSVPGALALAEGIAAAARPSLHTLIMRTRDEDEANATVWSARIPVSALLGRMQLDTIDLTQSGIGPLAAVVIGKLIETNTTLKYLSLLGNPIGDEAAMYVVQGALRAELHGLVMHRCLISTTGAAAIGLMLAQEAPTLGTISFDLSPLPVAELRGSNGVASLDLSNQDFGDVSATFIAEMLKHNTTLTTLNLSGNNISDKGGYSFEQALKLNRSLSAIQLNANALSESMKAHLKKLKRASLRSNKRPIDVKL